MRVSGRAVRRSVRPLAPRPTCAGRPAWPRRAPPRATRSDGVSRSRLSSRSTWTVSSSSTSTTRFVSSSIGAPTRAYAASTLRSICTPSAIPSCSVTAGSSHIPMKNDENVLSLTRIVGPKLRTSDMPPVGTSRRWTTSLPRSWYATNRRITPPSCPQATKAASAFRYLSVIRDCTSRATGPPRRVRRDAGRDTATTSKCTLPSTRRTRNDSSPSSGCPARVPYPKPNTSGFVDDDRRRGTERPSRNPVLQVCHQHGRTFEDRRVRGNDVRSRASMGHPQSQARHRTTPRVLAGAEHCTERRVDSVLRTSAPAASHAECGVRVVSSPRVAQRRWRAFRRSAAPTGSARQPAPSSRAKHASASARRSIRNCSCRAMRPSRSAGHDPGVLIEVPALSPAAASGIRVRKPHRSPKATSRARTRASSVISNRDWQ